MLNLGKNLVANLPEKKLQNCGHKLRKEDSFYLASLLLARQ